MQFFVKIFPIILLLVSCNQSNDKDSSKIHDEKSVDIPEVTVSTADIESLLNRMKSLHSKMDEGVSFTYTFKGTTKELNEYKSRFEEFDLDVESSIKIISQSGDIITAEITPRSAELKKINQYIQELEVELKNRNDQITK